MQSWRWVLAAMLVAGNARGQLEILPSRSTADLRGIDAVGKGVAWASGTEGTVLRTINDGKEWKRCATPPDAEHLDFRGVQALDETTAAVMSSGKGALSRLYKTTDGCESWKLVFTNPDPGGFWDALKIVTPKMAWILGDPVSYLRPNHKPEFAIYVTEDGGKSFRRHGYPTLEADPSTSGAFAASNSSLKVSASEDVHGWCWFGVGGIAGPRIFHGGYYSDEVWPDGSSPIAEVRWEVASAPMAKGAAAGIFSVAVRGEETNQNRDWVMHAHVAAVGGDYLKPDVSIGTAAFSVDGGRNWKAAQSLPHGFRSAVAYDAASKAWVTVGPNGTDISTDDGRNWRALRPNPALNEPADADQHWNALSLPFVVGPHGRIGKLRLDALASSARGAKP